MSEFTEEELSALMKAPLRTRTDEGTVQERSIDDLIKADQYLKGQAATDQVPYGMRIARTRPPGTI